MNVKFSKWSALCLSAVLLTSVAAGCGGSDSDTSESQAESSVSDTQELPSPMPVADGATGERPREVTSYRWLVDVTEDNIEKAYVGKSIVMSLDDKKDPSKHRCLYVELKNKKVFILCSFRKVGGYTMVAYGMPSRSGQPQQLGDGSTQQDYTLVDDDTGRTVKYSIIRFEALASEDLDDTMTLSLADETRFNYAMELYGDNADAITEFFRAVDGGFIDAKRAEEIEASQDAVDPNSALINQPSSLVDVVPNTSRNVEEETMIDYEKILEESSKKSSDGEEGDGEGDGDGNGDGNGNGEEGQDGGDGEGNGEEGQDGGEGNDTSNNDDDEEEEEPSNVFGWEDY